MLHKQKSRKKVIEKRSENRAGFEDPFFSICASFVRILGGQMEPKTEKKSIKNEVAKKMRKKCVPRARSRLAQRNVGRGGEDFRRGIRSNPGQKEQDRERKTEEKSSTPCPAS